jgi:hypothetical protein
VDFEVQKSAIQQINIQLVMPVSETYFSFLKPGLDSNTLYIGRYRGFCCVLKTKKPENQGFQAFLFILRYVSAPLTVGSCNLICESLV